MGSTSKYEKRGFNISNKSTYFNISTSKNQLNKINPKIISYIDAETNNLIVNMTLNDHNPNITKQSVDPPSISLNTSSFLEANIINHDSFKNLTLIKKKPIPILIHMNCLDYGNTTMNVLIPLKESNSNQNSNDYCNNFTFIKECYPPNFELNVYSKQPNSSLLEGDIVTDDMPNNTFYLTIEKNVSRYFIYLIAKNIIKDAHYTLKSSVFSNNETIGKATPSEQEIKLDAQKNKNYFEIDFHCFQNGSFLTYVNVDVKGYKRYSFILEKKCIYFQEFSWFYTILRSKYLIWMFFGSILLLLFALLLIANLNLASTRQDPDPPKEPNAFALSLMHDLKFSRALNRRFKK